MGSRIEYLLQNYKYSKARVGFLENQLKRLTPECHEDYIEYRMVGSSNKGSAPIFIVENGNETAKLNNVEDTAENYRIRCVSDYVEAKAETEAEIRKLQYDVALVEDGMIVLEQFNSKYKHVVESFYVNSIRMEDIAESMHISRSRCYELCKEATAWLSRVIYGESGSKGAGQKADKVRTTPG